MEKAQQARKENDIGAAKDAASLKATNLIQEYMDKKYVQNDSLNGKTTGQYVAEQMNGKTEGNYKFEVEGTTLKVLNTTTEEEIVGGTILDNGNISWGTTTPTTNNNEENDTPEPLEIGQIVQIANQDFYIIGYDNQNVTLLARYCLDISTTPYIQTSSDNNYGKVAYNSEDSENYDYSESYIKTYVDTYTSTLGVNASGRLLTTNDLERLGTIPFFGESFDYQSDYFDLFFGTQSYWLECDYDNSKCYYMSCEEENNKYGNFPDAANSEWGCRPVIIVSRSAI